MSCPFRAGRLALMVLVVLTVLPLVAAQGDPGTRTNDTMDQAANHTTGLHYDRPAHPWDPWTDRFVDSDTSQFLVDLAAWAVLGLLVMLVVAPLLKWATRRTPTDLDQHIIGIVATPAFLLVFTFGVVDSLRIFEGPSWIHRTLDSVWDLVLIILVAYMVFRVWHEVLRDVGARFAKRTKSDLDDRIFPLIDKTGGVIIIFVAVWFGLSSLGVNMTLFAAGGAIGGLVIAFAAQDTLANFFAGVQILLDRPFREGDRIEIREEKTWGDVQEIGLRTTRVRTQDNRMVIVPNSVIANNLLINHSFPDSHYRIQTEVGIAYGSDIEAARTAMVEAVRSLEGVLQDHPVEALFMGFGDSALNFRVRWWIASYQDTRRMFDKAHTALDRALRDAGIEIPFPQRVIWDGRRESTGQGAFGPAPAVAPSPRPMDGT